MAATRTALSTFAIKSPGVGDWTADTFTVTDGATLVVGFHCQNHATKVSDVVWDGQALTLRARSANFTNGNEELWVIENATGGTGDLVITTTDDEAIAGWASEIEGLASSAFDQSATGGNAAGTTVDTGDTGTLAQADEFLIGSIGARSQAAAYGNNATGSECDTAGQTAATAGGGGPDTRAQAGEFYATVASTAAVNMARDSMTSAAWSAALITFKIEVVAVPELSWKGSRPDVVRSREGMDALTSGMTPPCTQGDEEVVG